MKYRLNIGIFGTGLIEWGGGVDLLRIILGAINEGSPNSRIHLTLFLPSVKGEVPWPSYFYSAASAFKTKNPLTHLRKIYWQFRKVNPARTARDKILNVLYQSGAQFTVRHYQQQEELRRLIKRHRIDVLIPSLQNLGDGFPIPWVGYLPDLQHKSLPELFSQDERLARDKLFSGILNSAPVVVVTSQAVKKDIEAFFPEYSCKLYVWPFSPAPFDEWFDNHDEDVSRKYNLPARYFLISSQFWRHKSHLTAIKALALLRSNPEFRDVKLICTGPTDDYRHPGYFAEVQTQIADLDLQDEILILGYIPKRDQIEILKHSVCLIQPTLFEGTQGGLAVYDAVGLGVRAIVSDIPVNLEIDDPLVRFFRKESAEDLAEKMILVLQELRPEINKERQIQLKQQRIESLGDLLIEAIDAAIQSHGRRHHA